MHRYVIHSQPQSVRVFYYAVAALVAFGSYLMFMIVMVYFSRAEPTIGPISMAIKRGCTILGVVAVVTAIVVCILK